MNTLRCPRVLRNPLRRFFLNTRSFGPARLAVDHADHLRVGDERRAGDDVARVLFDEQHLVERELRARLAGRAVDLDDGAGRDLELAARA